jgi:DNA-binding helix-hairpin-helix protein with protein kinase domain
LNHAQFGLIHLDLSPKNFLVDPPKERVILIDLDALLIPGFTPPQILSPTSCTAPELITDATLLGKETMPSQITVRHTLAVLIYWLLFQRHPLIGPKKHSPDPEIDEAHTFGDRALFIEHPADLSNRPNNLVMPYTSVLTPAVQRLVERAFIDGIHVPEKRPTATEWVQCLSDMKASLSSMGTGA